MSRQSRVTADVTLEAHNLLRDYCKKHERSKGFLLEKMIRKFCGDEVEPVREQVVSAMPIPEKPKAPKIKRKVVSYPSNLDDQFLLLWDSKGKKGQKQKAYDIFRKMCVDVTDDICEQATLLMIADLHKNKHEAGYPERHLTSYLNGKFWEE